MGTYKLSSEYQILQYSPLYYRTTRLYYKWPFSNIVFGGSKRPISILNPIHVLIATIFLTWIRPFRVSNTPIYQESTYTRFHRDCFFRFLFKFAYQAVLVETQPLIFTKSAVWFEPNMSATSGLHPWYSYHKWPEGSLWITQKSTYAPCRRINIRLV